MTPLWTCGQCALIMCISIPPPPHASGSPAYTAIIFRTVIWDLTLFNIGHLIVILYCKEIQVNCKVVIQLQPL